MVSIQIYIYCTKKAGKYLHKNLKHLLTFFAKNDRILLKVYHMHKQFYLITYYLRGIIQNVYDYRFLNIFSDRSVLYEKDIQKTFYKRYDLVSNAADQLFNSRPTEYLCSRSRIHDL